MKNKEDLVEGIPKRDLDKILIFLKENYSFDSTIFKSFINAIYKNNIFNLLSISGHKIAYSKTILGKNFSYLVNFYLKSSYVLLEIIQYFLLSFRISNKEIFKAYAKIRSALPVDNE